MLRRAFPAAHFLAKAKGASLGYVIDVSNNGKFVTYSVRDAVLKRRASIDGKLLVLTDSPKLGSQELVYRQKSVWPASSATSKFWSPTSR